MYGIGAFFFFNLLLLPLKHRGIREPLVSLQFLDL
jgi:hypothetical protein